MEYDFCSGTRECRSPNGHGKPSRVLSLARVGDWKPDQLGSTLVRWHSWLQSGSYGSHGCIRKKLFYFSARSRWSYWDVSGGCGSRGGRQSWWCQRFDGWWWSLPWDGYWFVGCNITTYGRFESHWAKPSTHNIMAESWPHITIIHAWSTATSTFVPPWFWRWTESDTPHMTSSFLERPSF